MSLAVLRPLFLAAALLLAQIAAFAHAAEHLADEGGLPEPACEWCAAYAPFGAAAPAASPSQIAVAPQSLPGAARELPFPIPPPRIAYRAQAPPVLS
jgi:hypothetical protein